MTLKNKIALGIFGIWLLIFFGTVAISFSVMRGSLIEQLKFNATATARVLANALSDSPMMTSKDKMQSFLKTMVDSSDAARIQIRDAGNGLDMAIDASTNQSGAPALFGTLVSMPSPTGSMSIGHGEQSKGVVEVTVNNQSAIDSLFAGSMKLMFWSLVPVFLLGLFWWFAHVLMKPLQQTVIQARSLLKDDYTTQGTLPKNPELRDITLAMNKMVRKLQMLFQEQSRRVELLRQQAFQDPLTSLGNRRYFLHQMTSLLSDVDGYIPSYLLFVAIDGLRELNESEGYVQGDKTIIQAHQAIATFVETMPVLCIARVGGSQFGILVKALHVDLLTSSINELQKNLTERLQRNGHCKAIIGGAPCRFLQPLNSILAEADKALQIARDSLAAVHIFYNEESAPSPEMLGDLFNNGKVAMYWQKISNNQRILHRKMFAKIISQQGEEYSASLLIPTAEQEDMAWKIDTMVLDALEGVDPVLLEPFALSLSANTVTNKLCLDNYLQGLSKLSGAMRRLIRVDIPESVVLASPKEIKVSIREFQKFGIGVGIDQAGLHIGSMDYLQDLPIQYFKLHASLAKDIVDNESQHVFIQHFASMAETLDIQVIATQVENEDQWASLNSAGVVWGQGSFLGSVELVPAFNTPAAMQFHGEPA